MHIHIKQCRFVQRRRVRPVRRISTEGNRGILKPFLTCYLFAWQEVCASIQASMEQIAKALQQYKLLRTGLQKICQFSSSLMKRHICLWHLSRRNRNRLSHALSGNGGPGGGKGKQKGKKGKQEPSFVPTSVPPQDTSEDIRNAVQAVLPEAARLRMQSELLASEWDVPIYPWQVLSKKDGVALVPRSAIAQTLEQVGYTAHKVAILITEPPERFGLYGYHKEHVRIRILAINEDGDKVETSVMRFLVQVGFGPHVQQVMEGPQAQMFFTQKKMTGKMPEALGWPAGQKPAALVMTELTKHIPEEAISEILMRQDGSCAFYVHADYVDALLRASGQNNFFIKETTTTFEFHLLWLDTDVTLEAAIDMAKDESCYGIARKGAANCAKLAIRFKDKQAMMNFAKTHHIKDTSDYGRWKITGVDVTVGTFGLLGFLVTRGFSEPEVLYLKDSSGVFMSLQAGDTDPGFYMCNGTRRQFTFKALNNVAKEQTAKKSKEARQTDKSKASGSDVSKQQAFFRQRKPSALMAAPASPRTEPAKHKSVAKTGETPDPKAQKEQR